MALNDVEKNDFFDKSIKSFALLGLNKVDDALRILQENECTEELDLV